MPKMRTEHAHLLLLRLSLALLLAARSLPPLQVSSNTSYRDVVKIHKSRPTATCCSQNMFSSLFEVQTTALATPSCAYAQSSCTSEILSRLSRKCHADA